jgi:hypothetical protein
MTDTTAQPSNSAKEILKKTLLFSVEHFPVGALILGDKKSSHLHPRNPNTVSQEATTEINEVLKNVPLRDLVEAAISISPDGAPEGRTINDKIPLILTEMSPDTDFRLQWNPAGPLYVLDPEGPHHGDQFFIRIIHKHRCQ